MGNFLEEKCLREESLESLEEKISVFFEESSDDSYRLGDEIDGDDDESDRSLMDPMERAEFWLTQEKLLQEVLGRCLSGSKLRREVSRAVKIAPEATCNCRKPSTEECSGCLRRAVVDRLRIVGYDAALCTSKWKSMKEIPGGTHEYIDVVVVATDRKKEARFAIELEFRAQFEMAKACHNYQQLVNRLPETYVGKPDHLNSIVRIVCDAGKRSMKEKRIHMGPWRKRKFMLMKWSGSSRGSFSGQSPAIPVFSGDMGMPVLKFSLGFSAAQAVKVA